MGRERNVAVQTIKSIARQPWLGRPRTRTTWYEPLEAQEDIDLAVWWVLGEPSVFLNSVGDIDLLPRVLDAASRFERRPTEVIERPGKDRGRLRSLRGCPHHARAIHHDRGLPVAADLLGDRARDDVDDAAGGVGHDDADRPVRIIV